MSNDLATITTTTATATAAAAGGVGVVMSQSSSPLWVRLCGTIAPFASIIVFLAVSRFYLYFCSFIVFFENLG